MCVLSDDFFESRCPPLSLSFFLFFFFFFFRRATWGSGGLGLGVCGNVLCRKEAGDGAREYLPRIGYSYYWRGFFFLSFFLSFYFFFCFVVFIITCFLLLLSLVQAFFFFFFLLIFA
ncbi:hypothetical protein DFH27DRAFT_149412 [Peziza echinospora]|nr:hypothetical protein DFH27DRAFT_149412 [Peziza echinospora]